MWPILTSEVRFNHSIVASIAVDRELAVRAAWPYPFLDLSALHGVCPHMSSVVACAAWGVSPHVFGYSSALLGRGPKGLRK
jgi:hypothetical protein